MMNFAAWALSLTVMFAAPPIPAVLNRLPFGTTYCKKIGIRDNCIAYIVHRIMCIHCILKGRKKNGKGGKFQYQNGLEYKGSK